MSLSSANLLWQKRFRGLMPVAQHGIADSGHALLIRPDEMERRTYQVLSLDLDGNSQELAAIAVERVYRFDAVPDGRLLLGMTGDDIYLFRDSKKVRFMAERRVTYADAVLSPQTGWFVCGFSDSLFASHGIAFGDATGRLGWHKDMEAPVERVGLTHDGRILAVGLQDGRVRTMDNMRTPLWECALDEPVTALSMPGSGPYVVAGTSAGTLHSLDEDGGFRWRSPVGLPVVSVSVDRENRWVAAVHSDGSTHLLVCLGPDGSPVWELELDAKPTGVALSPNGRYLVVSTATGVASGFEVDFASTPNFTLGGRKARDLAAAEAAEAGGELAHAHDLLTALADTAPWDADVAARRSHVRDALIERLQAEAETRAAGGDWSEALSLLDRALQLAPFQRDLFEARLVMRERAVAGLRERAATLESTFDFEGACRLHAEALALAPEGAASREALQRIRETQAREYAREGDERLEQGDLQGAVQLWTQAQSLHPDDDLARRLHQAEVERCLTAGIAHYEAQRVPEAMFQFRKALTLDPGNETAQRYLGYTESVTTDTLIADRFARLE